MQKIEPLSLLILAGGRATRMQEQDKGLVVFNKKPLVTHLIDRFAPKVSSVFISCNRNFDEYQQFGYPLLPDQQSDFAGPLAGIEVGLAECPTPYLMVMPCDMPQLPADLIEKLWAPINEQSQNGENSTVNLITVAEDDERLQVLVMILPRECLGSIRGYLAEGKRSVYGWLNTQQIREVNFPGEQSGFANINTLTELADQERSSPTE